MKNLGFLTLLVSLLGCNVGYNEGSVALGNGYILVRLKGEVYVMHTNKTEEVIPSEVFTLGFTDKYIVSTVITNGTTNYWVLEKNSGTRTGPLSEAAYNQTKAKNKDVSEVRLKDVWDL